MGSVSFGTRGIKYEMTQTDGGKIVLSKKKSLMLGSTMWSRCKPL
jgi:hypothetical protein